MTQPNNYTPTTDFSQQESINASGRSTVNTAALDAEFANIETTLDQTVSNLSLIQRDDGRLKDVCVEIHTISPEVLNLIGGGYALRGLWAVATTYAVNDLCSNGAYTYVCRTAHASGGSFDGQYWTQFGFTSGADAAAAAAAAQNSATSAAGSATAAGNSAIAAASSASSVSGSAAAASSSASIATNKAGEAAGSATAAGNSAAAAAAAAASLGSPIPVSNGGTGATTAALARAAIGAAPLDSPVFSGNGSIAGTFSMGSAFAFRNRLINGNFSINQLGVSGSVVLTAGQYGHDGFKAGSGGCTYTFASSGGVTTLTISAGTLQQIIPGNSLQTGTHILGWNGTAQARYDTGSYGASPQPGTATAGNNLICEWGIGTLSLPQCELGTARTAFEFRDDELLRCQKYYRTGRMYFLSNGLASGGFGYRTEFNPPMAATPVIAYSNTTYLNASGLVTAEADTRGLTATATATASGAARFITDYTASARL